MVGSPTTTDKQSYPGQPDPRKLIMLPQRFRRKWHDGWQITAGLGSLLGALAHILTHQAVSLTPFALPATAYLWAGGAAVLGGLVWLPIACATWRPYVITEPGLGER